MGKELIPVASLARVSSVGQARDDRMGLPRQRRGIAEACARHGLHVVTAIELHGVSGAVVGQTSEWGEVRRLLQAGTIRGVVCDSVDRLCRASELDLSVLSDIQRVNGLIYTPSEARDLGSSTEGLVTSILALLGGVELSQITRKAVEAQRDMRADGRWSHDPKRLPMGVSYDPKTDVWAYTDDVHVLVDLARRYVSGEGSIRTLSARLGISYAKGRNGLSNPLYRGRMRDLQGGFVAVLNPPAIDAKLAAAIDAKLASQVRKYNGAGRRLTTTGHDPYLLRDVAICARCSRRMDTVVSRKRDKKRQKTYEWRYYQCAGSNRNEMQGGGTCDGPRIPIDDLHHAMAVVLAPDLRDRSVMEAAELALDLPPNPRPGEADRLRSKVADLEGQKTRLLRVYTRGLIDEDEFEKERAEVERKLEAVRVELNGIEAEAAEVGAARDGLTRFYEAVVDGVDRRDHDAICAALRDSGARVRVDRRRYDKLWKEPADEYPTQDGILVKAKRRGWWTVIQWLDVDVTRTLESGGSSYARILTKNGSSAPSTGWPARDTSSEP